MTDDAGRKEMPTREHYFVESADGGFKVRAKNSGLVYGSFKSEEEAIVKVNELNGEESPQGEEINNAPSGSDRSNRSE
jgi:hypothetical protein